MDFTISINHEKKYIHYTHNGKLNFDIIGHAWAALMSMEEFTQKKYNLLSDYRHGSFNMPLTEIERIIEFFLSGQEILRGKRQSLLVSTPYEVASSTMFAEEVTARVGFLVKVFSSEEAAVGWVSVRDGDKLQ